MKIILIACLMLVACKGAPQDLITLPQKQEVPDWVPPGIQVEVTADGKVVMTAELARAISRQAENKQRDIFLHKIATAADMGYRDCFDEFQGEARVQALVEELKSRGFAVTVRPVKNDWFILTVIW